MAMHDGIKSFEKFILGAGGMHEVRTEGEDF